MEENRRLNATCFEEEIKATVFGLNGDGACGPDGFNGLFFQRTWEVIRKDVCAVVNAFFQGQTLPKSITHTNLVLIPKKQVIHSFLDLRPISLSNFLNKIISRILHDRLDKILPKLISQNQSSFVEGRNISENVLLAQEIISDIRKRGKPANVIFKLDMAKAYDRVEWFFLVKALEKMGLIAGLLIKFGNCSLITGILS